MKGINYLYYNTQWLTLSIFYDLFQLLVPHAEFWGKTLEKTKFCTLPKGIYVWVYRNKLQMLEGYM